MSFGAVSWSKMFIASGSRFSSAISVLRMWSSMIWPVGMCTMVKCVLPTPDGGLGFPSPHASP